MTARQKAESGNRYEVAFNTATALKETTLSPGRSLINSR